MVHTRRILIGAQSVLPAAAQSSTPGEKADARAEAARKGDTARSNRWGDARRSRSAGCSRARSCRRRTGASPVAADGKLYLASEDSDIFVVKAGPKCELLAKNPMGQVIMATPAISNGVIIVRGLKDVFAVGLKRQGG